MTALDLQLVASLLRETLGDVEGVIDAQIYDEVRKDDFDAPDDREYSVTVTAKLVRQIGRALSAADAAARTKGRL